MTPFVTWGTNPGQGVPLGAAVPDPDDFEDAQRPGRRREGAGVHGPRGRHPDARDQGRHRLRRLLHQRPHRGPARSPPTVIKGRTVDEDTRLLVVPGSVRVRLQAEDEGLDVVFKEAGAEWRGAGCSMCLGMNPDQLDAGRAQRLDVQPQLRGPAGQGRAHPPGVACPSPPPPRSAARCRRPPTCRPVDRRSLTMEKFTTPHRRRRPAAPQQRRHRPDHPGGLPQAGHPHRLRGRPVRGLAQRPDFVLNRPEYAARLGARRRPRLRHRLVARARRVGAAELRLQGRDLAALRRHLPRQLRQGRAASPRRSTRRSCSGCGTTSRTSPARRSPSTSRRARCGPATASTRSRTPSTSTTTPAGGCSRASTTSASRSAHDDDIAAYEADPTVLEAGHDPLTRRVRILDGHAAVSSQQKLHGTDTRRCSRLWCRVTFP